MLCPPKAGWGWESVSAVPALAGRQNRKIFVSFRRSEAEAGGKTLGGIQSAKSSGFCSKKVRISSNRHHYIWTGSKPTAWLAWGREARSVRRVFPLIAGKASIASGGLREFTVRQITCRRVPPRTQTNEMSCCGEILLEFRRYLIK